MPKSEGSAAEVSIIKFKKIPVWDKNQGLSHVSRTLQDALYANSMQC